MFLTLLIVLLSLIVIACIDLTGNSNSGGTTGKPDADPYAQPTAQAAEATATYGAEQFYIQMTAIAEKDP